MSHQTSNRLPTLASRPKLLWGAIALAAFTGGVHIWLALEEWGEAEEAMPFLLAGLGFFVGIGFVLFTDKRRRLLYLLGAGFTAVQIPLWIIGGMEEFTVGVVDKIAQLLLVAILLYAVVQIQRASETPRSG